MTVLDYVKEAANLAKEHGRMDLYEKLLDYRAETAEMREENLKLKDEIRNLKQIEEIESLLSFHQGVYWIRSDPFTNGKETTPICPRCWDVDKVVVRHQLSKYQDVLGFTCKNCGKFFDRITHWPK